MARKNLNKLASLRLFLLYSFPVALYFSYYPLIPLGSNASMNFELSLPLIWLFLFSLLSLKDFYLYLKSLPKTLKSLSFSKVPTFFFSVFLFSLYFSLSILWSPNKLRGILTAGILWCILISLLGTVSLFKSGPIKTSLLKKIFLLSSAFVCLICWLQCFLDVFGVPRETTLLCLGCTSRIFGFPHPSGFAIEPQFMGNLLLAPTFYALYLFLTEQNLKNRTLKSLPTLLFLFSSTLFLTFSRGAIYAFGVGFLFFVGYNLIKKLISLKSLLRPTALLVLAFLFTLSFQGIFSELSSTNDTFSSGIAKSLNQLSLGLIDFRASSQKNLTLEESPSSGVSSPELNRESVDEPAEKTNLPEDNTSPEETENLSVFDGYVAESTNFRLSLNASALSASLDFPLNFFFGYGLGSAGTVLYEKSFTSHPKEIVQNEYFSLLLETGLLGIALFLLIIVVFFTTIIKTSPTPLVKPFLFSLTLAYLITLSFFSGFPNALHLYLLPPLFLFSFQIRTYRKLKS